MEPWATDKSPSLLQTASLASVVTPKVVLVKSSPPSFRRADSEAKDKASITAVKSPTASSTASLLPSSKSPSSSFGEPLSRAPSHLQEQHPISHLEILDCINFHKQHPDSSQLELGARSFADFVNNQFENRCASYETPAEFSNSMSEPHDISHRAATSDLKNGLTRSKRRMGLNNLVHSTKIKRAFWMRAVGERLKKKFRRYTKLSSKLSMSFTSYSIGSQDSDAPHLEHEHSETFADDCDPEFKMGQHLGDKILGYSEGRGTSLDSSVSSILTRNPFNDSPNPFSSPSLSSSTSPPSSQSAPESSSSPKQSIKLEDRLVTLARYGQLLEDEKAISSSLLQEIGQDSGVLLQQLCHTEVMQRLFDSGLLKEMIDSELLRRALDFFRLWVNIEPLEDLRAKSVQPEWSSDETSRNLSEKITVPALRIQVPGTPVAEWIEPKGDEMQPR